MCMNESILSSDSETEPEYLLRHCSQSRTLGLYDSVHCSVLHTDFPPELMLKVKKKRLR